MSKGQSQFYNSDSIREIRIYFEEDNWDELLDSLYVEGEKNRLTGSISIDGLRYEGVGIRYKGFSSVSVNRRKNPFNIKLDYTISGQNHEGFDKLKLSNVIQDPSFVREVLSYDIARQYMPASRANFANVYINDTLFGLYTNVEAVNKDFVAAHFSSRSNAFFKCNPEHLDLNGENSNLSTSPGEELENYYPLYDIESDSGWEQLYQLIDTLNHEKEQIEKVLNVDRTLWMHAFNYALVNFDSYIGYAQNYYLYRDQTGRFNPIIWDLNMSFGSFRFTDASNFYQGFTVEEAPYMDPLTHLNSVSVYARPMLRNLLENERYRKMFMAHLRTIMEENFRTNSYYSKAQKYQFNIRSHVQADTNKFYSDEDFDANVDSTVSDLIDYPGLRDLMEKRLAYLSTYPAYNGEPKVRNVKHGPEGVQAADNASVSAQVEDAREVILFYRNGENELFMSAEMLDDGRQMDTLANDGIYTASIENISNNVQYYVYAENDSAGTFSPSRAAYELYQIWNPIEHGDLVINEVMANNGSVVVDENGEYSDWIELFNPRNHAVSTKGMFLSDDVLNKTKWAMPDATVEPGGYLIVWANGSKIDGLNSNFRLSAKGERLWLGYGQTTVLDSVEFGEMLRNSAFARTPNGTGPFQLKFSSFGRNNDLAEPFQEFDVASFVCFPNPTLDGFSIKIDSENPSIMQLIDLRGQLIIEESIEANRLISSFSTSELMSGVYLIRIINDGHAATKKLIKL